MVSMFGFPDVFLVRRHCLAGSPSCARHITTQPFLKCVALAVGLGTSFATGGARLQMELASRLRSAHRRGGRGCGGRRHLFFLVDLPDGSVGVRKHFFFKRPCRLDTGVRACRGWHHTFFIFRGLI